jgi:mRNA-degrading endonuclease RelE of RelBE toxin-antitoxin system
MFEIEFTPESIDDLIFFRKHEQVEIVEGIETQLLYEPIFETKKRKWLRPNEIAEWELRIGKFRVFYNVDKEKLIVSIEAIGFKIGNVLFIRDKERKL